MAAENTMGFARRPIIAPQVLAMLVVVFTEVMFFAALISAYVVIKSTKGFWVPPFGVKLPIEITLLNTVGLMLSGAAILSANQKFLGKNRTRLTTRLLLVGFCLGSIFVGVQGLEWLRLLELGMNMKAGIFSATFFLLIGSHALHALVGTLILFVAWRKSAQSRLSSEFLTCTQIFWLFVVGVWPILFRMVYF